MPLLLSGTVAGQAVSWPLDADVLGVGRSSRHPVHLPDATVSKDHAEIAREGAEWQIRDLGSRNGTRVNGTPAATATPLRPGDVVEIGSVVLRVSAGETIEPTRFSPSPRLGSTMRLAAQDFLGRPAAPDGDAAMRLVRLLAEAGRVLVLPRPLDETCEEILQFVERAVPAGRLVILLRGEDGGDPVQIAARYRGVSAHEPLALSRTILATVLDECTSVVIRDARLDPRFQAQHSIVSQGTHSAVAVPLFDNERVLGLLYVDTGDLTVEYGQEHLEVLTLLANMAAVKITNARLLEAEQVAARMAHELASAARIQRGLLPAAPPEVPGWEVDAFLESCHEVGGDLYDFHRLPDGRLLFVAGDVVGKGMGAALLMSSFLASARVLYDVCGSPAALAARLNDVIHRDAGAGRFVTGFVGLLDPDRGTLDFVNAGHPPPCAVRDGVLRLLEGTGLPFGILPGSTYEQGRIEIAPGEMIALYSDGLPEAQHGEEFFDDERLHAALRAASAEARLDEARKQVLATVRAFIAGAPRSDDLTLLLIRRAASASAAPAPRAAEPATDPGPEPVPAAPAADASAAVPGAPAMPGARSTETLGGYA
jgi:phosphoserine phosphatase RsbU/P